MPAGRIAVACALLQALAGAAVAQADYPDRPLRLVVGAAPGTSAEFLARTLAAQLTAHRGMPVVVDHRPGMRGALAAELIAHAAPDGGSLLVADNGLAVNAVLPGERLPFDTGRAFAGVTRLADVAHLLIAAPALPVGSVRELIALARTRPVPLAFGSDGVGSVAHMSAAAFGLAAGFTAAHEPARNASELVGRVMRGEPQWAFVSAAAVAPLARAGMVKALAVSTTQRSAVLPDVPTVSESGVAGFDLVHWHALFVPASTPDTLRGRLSVAVHEILALPDVMERLAAQGAVARPTTPAALDAFLREEIARLRAAVTATGMQAK